MDKLFDAKINAKKTLTKQVNATIIRMTKETFKLNLTFGDVLDLCNSVFVDNKNENPFDDDEL